jgi:hypothetical protein
MPPTSPPSPIQGTTAALVDAVGQLAHYASAPGSAEFKAAFDQATQLFAGLRDQLSKSKTSSISDFFSAVGSSVIEAQNRLDHASEAYVRSSLRLDGSGQDPGGAAAAPPVLGTIYRIPRVTAELKCSLAMDHEKGFNVVFYSERSDVRELHQQTVQLEVVSVPVPPDYINYLRTQPAAQSLSPAPAPGTSEPQVFSDPGAGPGPADEGEGPLPLSEPAEEIPDKVASPPAARRPGSPPPLHFPPGLPPLGSDWLQPALADWVEREQLRALLEKLDAQQRKESGRRRSPVSKLLLPSWARAIVLTDRHNARFILLALVHKKRPRLLLWQLVLYPASLQLLYKMSDEQRPELVRLQRFLAELGMSQAASEARGR